MHRKGILILVLFTLLFGLLGCGQPAALSNSAPMARYMPTGTPAFLSVLMRPEGDTAENWSRIRGAFANVPVIKEGVEEFNTEMREGLPFDWKTDIDPWLGETMAIGVMDLTPLWKSLQEEMIGGSGEHPVPPPFLLAIEVGDYEAFEGFINVLRLELERNGLTLGESTFEDTTIYNIPMQDEETEIFFAVHDERVLLVSNERPQVEGALTRKESDALSGNQKFLDLLERMPGGGLIIGYADYAVIQQGMRDILSEAGEVSLPSNFGAGIRAAALTVLAEEEGIRVESVTSLDLAALAEAGLKEFYEDMRALNEGHALEFVPKEATLALSGQNLRRLWEMQAQQMQDLDTEAYEDFEGTLEDLAIETGLDVQEDIISWMTGEYALFLAPGEELGAQTMMGFPTFQMGLLFEVEDQEKVAQAMKKVEALVIEQAGLPSSFYDKDIEGVNARVIPSLEQMGYLPGYAFVDDFLLIAIDEASFRSAILASKDKGARLAGSSEFKKVSEFLPEENSGIFFLDMGSLTRFLDASLIEPELTDFRKDAKPLLDVMGGMGMANTTGKEYAGGSFFLHIPK
jgi:hypothetical protein